MSRLYEKSNSKAANIPMCVWTCRGTGHAIAMYI